MATKGTPDHHEDDDATPSMTPLPGKACPNDKPRHLDSTDRARHDREVNAKLISLLAQSDIEGAQRYLATSTEREVLFKLIAAGYQHTRADGPMSGEELLSGFEELLWRLRKPFQKPDFLNAPPLPYIRTTAWRLGIDAGRLQRRGGGFQTGADTVIDWKLTEPLPKTNGRRKMDVVLGKEFIAQLLTFTHTLPPRQQLVLQLVADEYEKCLGEDGIDTAKLTALLSEQTGKPESSEAVQKVWAEVKKKLVPLLQPGWSEYLNQEKDHDGREGRAPPGAT